MSRGATIDPRNSPDVLVRESLATWDRVNASREEAYESARRLRESLRNTDSHQAYGWATATIGRIEAYREFPIRADGLLAEAYGRLFIADDRYGLELVTSNLAIPQVTRGALDRALELAVHPLNSDIQFSDSDQALLHNVVAICHSERQEFHAAIFQINKEYEIVRRSGDAGRISVALGNLGGIFLQVGAWELALEASSEAWRLQFNESTQERESHPANLANTLFSNTQLNRLERAGQNALELAGYLRQLELPTFAMMHCYLSMFFSRTSDITQAKDHLEKAKTLAKDAYTAHQLDTASVMLLEAQNRYKEAIEAAQRLLDLPSKQVLPCVRLVLASVLQRCNKSLGNDIEAHKWLRFQEEFGRSVLLGDMLTSQIRSNLNVNLPANPLTDRELTCLRLSAHGQTSADIGLKLGMKTRTVNFHFSNILRKLNAMNRQEAIAKAVSANLLKRD